MTATTTTRKLAVGERVRIVGYPVYRDHHGDLSESNQLRGLGVGDVVTVTSMSRLAELHYTIENPGVIGLALIAGHCLAPLDSDAAVAATPGAVFRADVDGQPCVVLVRSSCGGVVYVPSDGGLPVFWHMPDGTFRDHNDTVVTVTNITRLVKF